MFANLKRQWTQLKRSAPGTRFRDRYDARHDPGKSGRSRWSRAGIMALAAVLAAIGVVLVFIPGPAILFFFLAGALLAEESCAMARALDWLELRLRSLVRRLAGWWRERSFAAKSLTVIVVGHSTLAWPGGALPLI